MIQTSIVLIVYVQEEQQGQLMQEYQTDYSNATGGGSPRQQRTDTLRILWRTDYKYLTSLACNSARSLEL